MSNSENLQPEATDFNNSKINIGISECLLGSPVRFNGGHKHSKLCTKELGDYFKYVPTCPEMAIGLGVPRKPIRLVNIDNEIRVRGTEQPDLDVTVPLGKHASEYLDDQPSICGFIFTQNSPSCGLKPVKVYHANGNPLTKSTGAFAGAFISKAPYLPVEEAGRLNDPLLRETFITAVFAYHEWLKTVDSDNSKKALVDFHSRNKYLLMSHSIQEYKFLGNLISNLKDQPLEKIKSVYRDRFMQAIRKPSTPGMQCNTMSHVQGYLKKHLSTTEKSCLNKSIDDYRNGYVPLVVPMTLLDHYTKVHFDSHAYIRNQSYLNPHPLELGLRNEI